MTHLIELKDSAIGIRNTEAELARSPGFANIANKAPVFGEDARQMARLHPRQSFNQFWAQLSLDPLVLKNRFFRHNADLAHSHLQILTQDIDLGDGAILAVPSHYNRNQLAVLLGIVKQCHFDAVGLVDLSLLQAGASEAESCIIIDLQLHQCVLSSFRRVGEHLVRDHVVQIPASGLLTLQDAWCNMITDEFIRQCRFDPHHNAETEQYIYNQLPQWIEYSARDNEVLAEINHKGTVHQAHLTREQFDQHGKALYLRIARELDTLRTPETTVHTSAANLALPGLSLHLPGLVTLDDDSSVSTCMHYLDHIRRPSDSLPFITRLPLVENAMSVPLLQTRQATHVLFRHRALPLPAGRLLFGTAPTGLDCARVVPVPELPAGQALALTRGTRGAKLELHGAAPQLGDGNSATDGQPLPLGSLLRLTPKGPDLQLITVE